MRNRIVVLCLTALLVVLALSTVAQGQTTQQRINALVSANKCGYILQDMAMNRCAGLAPWNRPYEGDGVKDCYGYSRQVWNAILFDGSVHSEDYSTYSYTRANYWLGIAGGIPVNTYPDANWSTISSLGGVGNLLPGDLCGTTQGHRWGMDVHYGIYAGKDANGNNMCWQCGGGYNGAYYTPWYTGWTWYYRPLHVALATPPAGDVVIDNTAPEFSCSANWAIGTGAGKYGSDYRWRSTQAISDMATWTPNITGNYAVYAWWAAGTNRYTAAPYKITDSGGTVTTVTVNQQINGGQWNYLGTWNLGPNSKVQLSCWCPTGYVVIADAVLFSPR